MTSTLLWKRAQQVTFGSGQKPLKNREKRREEQNSRISLVKGERDIRYAFSSPQILNNDVLTHPTQ